MNCNQATSTELSVEEVAKILGSTPINVLILVKRGELAGRELDHGWAIDRKSLEAFQAGMGDKSSKAACRSACSKAGGCGSCE